MEQVHGNLDAREHPLHRGQVIKAGVPPVRNLHVLAAVRVAPPPGPAAAVLVNAQVSHRLRVSAQDPGQSVTAHASTAPSGPSCTSVTRRPSMPNSADAVSRNTMPAASSFLMSW